jgi:hypothetical protein
MLNLRAAGVSDRCETLPEELDPQTIANLSLEGENARAFALENLRVLERLGNEPELALETAVETSFGESWRADSSPRPAPSLWRPEVGFTTWARGTGREPCGSSHGPKNSRRATRASPRPTRT